MNDYFKVRIDASPCSEDVTDLLAAFLADVGFESFEPDNTGLTAYIPANYGQASQMAIEATADFPMPVDLKFSQTYVKGENWNEEWEKNYFQPILIGDKCVVHSTFHKDVPKAQYDIVIDPKMAFGTGHHDTTSQMIQLILDEDVEGKTVIDMGTGTGILAILAAKRGAKLPVGIEIDEGAFLNAGENTVLNNVVVDLRNGDASSLSEYEPADFLFANINRNIILADLAAYYDALLPGGTMLLSGFYERDIQMILEAAAKFPMPLREAKRLVSNDGWTALKLVK